jgi:hypothetical protein
MNLRFYPITLGTFESLDILLSIFAHTDDAMSKWVGWGQGRGRQREEQPA